MVGYSLLAPMVGCYSLFSHGGCYSLFSHGGYSSLFPMVGYSSLVPMVVLFPLPPMVGVIPSFSHGGLVLFSHGGLVLFSHGGTVVYIPSFLLPWWEENRRDKARKPATERGCTQGRAELYTPHHCWWKKITTTYITRFTVGGEYAGYRPRRVLLSDIIDIPARTNVPHTECQECAHHS